MEEWNRTAAHRGAFPSLGRRSLCLFTSSSLVSVAAVAGRPPLETTLFVSRSWVQGLTSIVSAAALQSSSPSTEPNARSLSPYPSLFGPRRSVRRSCRQPVIHCFICGSSVESHGIASYLIDSGTEMSTLDVLSRQREGVEVLLTHARELLPASPFDCLSRVHSRPLSATGIDNLGLKSILQRQGFKTPKLLKKESWQEEKEKDPPLPPVFVSLTRPEEFITCI